MAKFKAGRVLEQMPAALAVFRNCSGLMVLSSCLCEALECY